MRRFSGIVFSLVLLGQLQISPAFSASKVGSKCLKAGLSATSAGKTLKCTKSGSKLVWKDVTPVSIAPASGPLIPPLPSVTTRRQKALAVMRDVYLRNKPYDVPLQLTVSSDALPQFVSLVQQMIPIAGRLWSDVYQPTEFPIVIGNSKSVEWVDKEIGRFGFRLSDWTQAEIKRQGPSAGRGNAEKNEKGMFTYYVIGDGQVTNPADNNRGFIAHEYVHAVHISLFNDRNEGLPQWVIEGGANFYGYIATGLASKNYEAAYEAQVNMSLRRPFDQGGLILHDLKRSELYDAIVKSEQSGPSSTCAEPKLICYTAGLLMTELLVGDYGHEKLLSWWRTSTTMNWEDAFEKTYGIDINKWYEEVAVPYIMSVAYRAYPQAYPNPDNSPAQPREKRPSRLFVPAGYRSENALKSLREVDALPRVAAKSPELRIIVGPGTDANFAAKIKRVTEATLIQWGDLYGQKEPFTIIYGSDLDWTFSQIDSVDSRFSQRDRDEYRSQVAKDGYVVSLRWAGHSDYILTADALKGFGEEWQLQEIAGNAASIILLKSTLGHPDRTPCWAQMGSRSYMALTALRKSEFVDYFTGRRDRMSNWERQRDRYFFQSMPTEKWEELIAQADGTGSVPCISYDLASPAGFVLFELLVAQFGPQKIGDWWGEVGRGAAWQQGFQTAFGVPFETWKTTVAIPYLVQEFRNSYIPPR